MIDLSPITEKPVTYFLTLTGALIFVATRQNTWLQRSTAVMMGGLLALGLSDGLSIWAGVSPTMAAVIITIFGQLSLETVYSVFQDRRLMRAIAVEALQAMLGRLKK